MTAQPDPKAIVHEFYDLSFNQKQPEEAVRRHIGAYYRQHNPQAPDGAEAFIGFVKGFVAAYPNLHFDFKRLLADDDLVAVHSHLVLNSGERGTAVMDMFRLEGDKIVEHWDVLQDVPETAANPNTMF